MLVAFGTYGRVVAVTGVGIYGADDATSWQRRDQYPDGLPVVSGSPEGMLPTAPAASLSSTWLSAA